MAAPALILCGSTKLTSGSKAWTSLDPVRVAFLGPHRTATLRIEDITDRMVADLPPAVADLVELSAYVYCADQAVGRGGKAEFEYGQKWRRRFRFEVPVRRPDLWSSPTVKEQLEATLGFLSDDVYEFAFGPLADSASLAPYLFAERPTSSVPQVDSVTLFSGGVDSLTGAATEVLTEKRRVALVSHRSVAKIDSRQRDLVQSLRERAGAARVALHVPVWVHQHGVEAREYTQRTRSFLYTALGTAVARMYGLDRLRVYENGVVSLNLPICEHLVGARATRTTHPKVIRGLSALFGVILERPFALEAPFEVRTKTEVVSALREAGQADLAKHTVSCTRTKAGTKMHTHCGRCSQCIDRRFAMLAAGCAGDDPAEMYAVDLLTGVREKPEDRTMIESWVRMATEIESIPDATAFFTRFPEANDAIAVSGQPADAMATRIFELHKRHASQVGRVLEEAIKSNANAIWRGDLPDTCLVRLLGPRMQGPEVAPSSEPPPNPVGNATLARAADLADPDHMSRAIQTALSLSGEATGKVRRGHPRRWTHRQLRRALPHLPDGKLRDYLRRSGLGEPEGT